MFSRDRLPYPRRLLLSAVARNGSLRHRFAPLRSAPLSGTHRWHRFIKKTLLIAGLRYVSTSEVTPWKITAIHKRRRYRGPAVLSLFIAGAEMKFLEGGRNRGRVFLLIKSHANTRFASPRIIPRRRRRPFREDPAREKNIVKSVTITAEQSVKLLPSSSRVSGVSIK